MGVVGALVAVEVRAIAAIAVGSILGAEALVRRPGLDQRAVHGEVIVAHEALRLLVHGGEKNCCATSLLSSRSRFLEKTVWFHTASSMPRPTNQRNSRL
jgi:hypothetical protein